MMWERLRAQRMRVAEAERRRTDAEPTSPGVRLRMTSRKSRPPTDASGSEGASGEAKESDLDPDSAYKAFMASMGEAAALEAAGQLEEAERRRQQATTAARHALRAVVAASSFDHAGSVREGGASPGASRFDLALARSLKQQFIEQADSPEANDELDAQVKREVEEGWAQEQERRLGLLGTTSSKRVRLTSAFAVAGVSEKHSAGGGTGASSTVIPPLGGLGASGRRGGCHIADFTSVAVERINALEEEMPEPSTGPLRWGQGGRARFQRSRSLALSSKWRIVSAEGVSPSLIGLVQHRQSSGTDGATTAPTARSKDGQLRFAP